MRVVVFGAGGRAGSKVVHEASARGHEVTAVVRDAAKAQGLPADVEVAQADITEPALTKGLAGQADALVITVGGPDPRLFPAAFENVVEAVRSLSEAARPRIVHLGGGGSLLDADGVRFVDHPEFPDQYRANSLAQAEVLEMYRALEDGIDWTYVSPPPVNLVEGARVGAYRTSLEHPVIGADGDSRISYDDLAIAIVDELERPAHRRERFTVGY